MKTLKLLTAAGLFAGLASVTFAGPGVDYWNRMRAIDQNRADAKAKVESPAKASPAPSSTNCASCSCGAKKA